MHRHEDICRSRAPRTGVQVAVGIESSAVGCGFVLHETLPVDSMSGVGRVRTTSSVSGECLVAQFWGLVHGVLSHTPTGTASF